MIRNRILPLVAALALCVSAFAADPKDPLRVAVIGASASAGFGCVMREKRADGDYDYRTIERVPVMTLYPGIERSPDAPELTRMLGLPAKPESFRLVSSEDIWPGDTLSMRARSCVATLQLLSMGVDAFPGAPPPAEDIDTESELYARMATADQNQDLAPFVGAVFRVRCSTSRPADALTRGVRPISPIITTSVSASRPRASRSSTSVAKARSAGGMRSVSRLGKQLKWTSQPGASIPTKRHPASTRRRARRARWPKRWRP